MANSFRPSEGSYLDRVFAKKPRHPAGFDCGVRVREGKVRGEKGRWRYRFSWVEPRPGEHGDVILHHGDDVILRLHVDATSLIAGGGRQGEFSFLARDEPSGSTVQVSVQAAELLSFGIED